MHRDHQVRRQGPGCGGPDQEGDRSRRLLAKKGAQRGRIFGFEANVDRRIFAVLVFEFGVGQRGLIGDRPMHRFEVAINQPLLDQRGKDLEHGAFVARRHGEVGVLVIGEGQETLHLFGLQALEVGGVVVTGLADLAPAGGRLELVEFFHLARLEQLAHHLVFDRQTMAIPARHIVATFPFEVAGAHHQILQHLVEQVADVDRAVGKRRAIVENEGGSLSPTLEKVLVQPGRIPALRREFLVFGQVGPHRKGGIGQVERGLVFGFALFRVGRVHGPGMIREVVCAVKPFTWSTISAGCRTPRFALEPASGR